jgi:TRAP-type mannitol/chloroaromatic compound transport system substrate-binding protein
MSWKAIDRYSTDYIEMREKQGVRFYKTPDSVLRAQLAAWDTVTAKKSGENPMFKTVLESMRNFARRCGGWQNDTLVDYRMAYNHYFAKPTPTKS